MQKHFALFAAASLAVGTWAYAADPIQPGGNNPNPAGQTDNKAGQGTGAAGMAGDRATTQPSGQNTLGAEATTSIQRSLGEITSAVLSKDGLKNISSHVSRADRDRLQQKQENQDNQAWNDTLDKFQQQWKEKYGKDFDLKGDQAVFSGADFRIIGGDLGDMAQPAGGRTPAGGGDLNRDQNRPGDLNRDNANPRAGGDIGRPGGQAGGGVAAGGQVGAGDTGVRAGGQVQRDANNPGTGAAGGVTARAGDANRPGGDQARPGGDLGGQAQPAAERTGGAMGAMGDRAHLMISASHGLPEVRVPLAKEGQTWVIDLPESLTADKLQTNLNDHLKQVVDAKDKWPADATEAYRVVSHHVFLALTDGGKAGQPHNMGDMNKAGGAGATGGDVKKDDVKKDEDR